MKTKNYKTGRLFFFALACIALLSRTAVAQSMMQGPNHGTSTVVIANSHNTWQNTANVFFCDDRFAYVALEPGKTSDTMEISNFKFDIPADAIIEGITVTVRKGATDDGVTDNSIKLILNGKVQGTDHARQDNWNKSAEVSTYGGDSDLWGLVLTPSAVSSYNFGLALSAANSLFSDDTIKAEIDYISISVNYKKPEQIDITEFTAYFDENQVNLNWTVAAHSECVGFTIERSADGLTTEAVGSVHGSTFTNQENSYSFADSNPLSGTSYYRLVERNSDGTAKASNWVAVSAIQKTTKVMLFPNPTDDILTVKFPSMGSPAILMVIDAAGRIIMNASVVTLANEDITTSIQDVSFLTQGIYTMVISSGEKNYSVKFVKD
jgi:hypothetical protein